MINETKLKNSFTNVRKEIDGLKYECSNQLRFLNIKVKEQEIRITELERRLAQTEILLIREQVSGDE